MKKIGILLLALVLVSIGVATFIIFKPLEKKNYAIEDVLPEGPLVFGSTNNVEKNIQKFTSTKFWQKIQSLDYKTIMKLIGVKSDEAQMYENLIEQMTLPENRKILSEFFGQEIAVGIYPVEIKALTPAVFQDMTSHVFFVTRLKPKAKFAEFISGFMSKMNSDVKVQPVKYKNHTIMMASGKNDALTMGYVIFGDLLIFGLDDKAAKACVDTVTKTTRPLSSDAAYQKAKAKFLPGAEKVGFMNFEKFMGILKNQVLQIVSKDNPQAAQLYRQHFEKSFRETQGFQSFGYSVKYDDLLKFKVDVHFDKSKLDPVVAEMYSCPPGKNESLVFVPVNTIAYQWNNCYSLKQYWEQAKEDLSDAAKMAPGDKKPEDMIGEMEKSLGLSIENDVIPAIGKEFGGVLTDVKLTDAFPVPQMLFFVETADREKAQKLVNTLLGKQPALQMQAENYHDTALNYVTIPLLVANLEPAYAYLGKYFVLSTDRVLLKQAIDTMKDGSQSLTSSPRLKELNLDITAANNVSLFVDFQQLMQKLEGLVDWSGKWATSEQGKREAFKTGGQKRLADLESEIKTQETDLANLKQQLQAAQNAPVTDAPGAAPTPAQINEQIQKKQQDLDANRQKSQELTELIDQYSQPVNTQADKQLVETFVKPLIQAFQFLRGMVSTTQIKDGRIETLMQLKVE
jgi:hypothetical protein